MALKPTVLSIAPLSTDCVNAILTKDHHNNISTFNESIEIVATDQAFAFTFAYLCKVCFGPKRHHVPALYTI